MRRLSGFLGPRDDPGFAARLNRNLSKPDSHELPPSVCRRLCVNFVTKFGLQLALN